LIGVLDSGAGGITAVRELRKLLPYADVLFLPDRKNAPYGTKTKNELIPLVERDIEILLSRGADTVLIESNHDYNMLCDGPYPVYLKRRILSDRGHLSNVDCARLARELADKGTRRIILGHLSRENNRPGLAMAEAGQALMGSGAELFCAPVFGCLELETEEDALCSL
jgi:hypothetical protein